jgi:hypothetical protein
MRRSVPLLSWLRLPQLSVQVPGLYLKLCTMWRRSLAMGVMPGLSR